jgi:hypothetical protein
MKTQKVIAEIKELYKRDKALALKAAKALGFKITMKENEQQRIAREIKALYQKDSRLAIKVAKVLGFKITIPKQVNAAGWGKMPRGWTMESIKKFWNSLTGDRKHRITQCIKKMTGKIDNPGAFCGSLAKKIEYSPKLKSGQKGPWWLKSKLEGK